MNKNMKNALKLGFEPPSPKREREFLSQLKSPKAKYSDFFLSQIGFIRKRVWFFSGIVTIAIAIFMPLLQRSIQLNNSNSLLWLIAGIIPFLALITVTELARSTSYKLDELELSCKYSLSHIIMTRATILGVVNFLLMLVLICVVGIRTEYTILSVSLYVITPYLLTCFASLLALNLIKGSESVYCCAIIAGVVGLSQGIMCEAWEIAFTQQYLWVWGVVSVLCIILLIIQANKFMKISEEIKWNLLSTD